VRFLLVELILFCLLSACSTCKEKAFFKNNHDCKEDSDCILIKSICNEPKAINRYFIDEYVKSLDRLNRAVLCQGIKEGSWPDGIKSACESNKCIIRYGK